MIKRIRTRQAEMKADIQMQIRKHSYYNGKNTKKLRCHPTRGILYHFLPPNMMNAERFYSFLLQPDNIRSYIKIKMFLKMKIITQALAQAIFCKTTLEDPTVTSENKVKNYWKKASTRTGIHHMFSSEPSSYWHIKFHSFLLPSPSIHLRHALQRSPQQVVLQITTYAGACM